MANNEQSSACSVGLARPVPGVQGAQARSLFVLVLAHAQEQSLEHVDRLADVGGPC